MVEKEKQELLLSNPFAFMTNDQLKVELKNRQLKVAGKKGGELFCGSLKLAIDKWSIVK